MQPLYLVAAMSPRTDRLVEAKTALTALIEATLQEDGCELYDLVVSPDDSGTWLMLEKWASKQAWEAHMQTAHVIAHNATSDAFLAGPSELRFYDPV